MATTLVKDSRMDLRIAQEHKEMIEKAARLQGSSVAQFITARAVEAAQEVLEKQHMIRMSQRDYECFVAALDADEAPNEAAMAAAARFNAGRREGNDYRW